MKPDSFFHHLKGHPIPYAAILCLCAVVALTVFRVTAPSKSGPSVLLIEEGGTPPDMEYDATVAYAAADANPEFRQTYVLLSGSFAYDLICAPEALLGELFSEQLIQPLSGIYPDACRVGDTAVALPLSGGYCLCLSHHANSGTEMELALLAQAQSAQP